MANIVAPDFAARIILRTSPEVETLVLDHYRIGLRVTPRPPNARVNYRDRWGPHRFEPLGDIVLMPPGKPVTIRCDTAVATQSFHCDLKGRFAARWLAAERWSDAQLLASTNVSSLTVLHLLRRLADEIGTPRPGGEELATFIVGQVVIELSRYLAAVGDDPPRGGLADWRLRLIDERLAESGPPPGLADLAALCRMSVRHLMRAFRISRGCTLGDYMLHSRIERAKRLLHEDLGLKAIAQDVGYATSSSFASAFRKATGLRPLDFRKRIVNVPSDDGAHEPDTA